MKTHTTPDAPRVRRKPRIKRPRIKYDDYIEVSSLPCAVCGDRIGINVDHVVPVCKGGTSHRSNLQPLCRWCNGIKGGRLMTNEQIAERRNRW